MPKLTQPSGHTTPDESVDSSKSAPRGEQHLRRSTSVGRYIVLEMLGRGGMGVVYAAYDPELDRKVALKLLRHEDQAAAPDRSRRLLDEAKKSARLAHHNVVKVYDVGTFLDQVFVAMQFMSKGTLRDWLDEAPRTPRQIVAKFLEAGEGLAAAHAVGLVHRDFKADNVLIDAHGVPQVSDFGLAQLIEDGTDASVHAVGTPGFMAPEQARREPVDARADQFSFCASLYLALFGELPFPKDLEPQRPLPLPKPAAVGSTVPAWLRRAVLKGLAEDPRARFDSMRELLTVLADDPALRRRQRLLALAPFVSLVAIVGVGVAFFTRETAEERLQRACSDEAKAKREAVWGDRRRAEIEAAFRLAQGAAVWEQVHERFGGDVARWTEASIQVCSLPQGEARRQMAACLEERRKIIESMSDLLSTADRGTVENAISTVTLEVQPVEACRPGVVVEKAKPAPRQDVEQMRSGLAKARVLRAAAKYTQAIVEALKVVNEAEDADAVEIKAEAELAVGELYAELVIDGAEEYLRAAIVSAESIGNAEIRARAWIALAGWSSERGKPDDARFAERAASSILTQLGRPPLLDAAWLTSVGRLAMRQGRVAEAQRAFERALELRRAHLPADHPLVLRSLQNWALSLPPKQRVPLLESVLDARRKLFGARHAETAIALSNLAEAHMETRECAAALELFQTALDVRLERVEDNPAGAGRSQVDLARALECLQRFDEGVDALEEAVALLARGGASDTEQHEVQAYLAEQLKLVQLQHRPQQLKGGARALKP